MVLLDVNGGSTDIISIVVRNGKGKPGLPAVTSLVFDSPPAWARLISANLSTFGSNHGSLSKCLLSETFQFWVFLPRLIAVPDHVDQPLASRTPT